MVRPSTQHAGSRRGLALVAMLLAATACKQPPAESEEPAAPVVEEVPKPVETVESVEAPAAPAARRTTTGRVMARLSRPSAGLPHLAKINDTLYRGAQPTAEGYRALAAMGVKTVVSLRKHHRSAVLARAAGLTHVSLPIRADIVSTPPSRLVVKTFFETVLAESKQPVFFHCMTGKDRTGTMAALYRIEVDGWKPAEAVEEMRAFGYHTYFRDLIKFVRRYRKRGYAEPR